MNGDCGEGSGSGDEGIATSRAVHRKRLQIPFDASAGTIPGRLWVLSTNGCVQSPTVS